MGVIKAAIGAVGSTLHDQWKEYIKCEDLGNDILMKRVSTPNGIITKDIVNMALGKLKVDKLGLDETDYNLLKSIVE